jgi:hypothetical protein
VSKHTEKLEADLTEKKKTAAALTEKAKALDAKIEAASFEKRPALREELASARAELGRAEEAVREAEAPLPRARALDERAARIASFRDLDARAATAGKGARAAVVTAVRALSEACALGKAASGLAVELGGSSAGYTASADAIGGIHERFFESLSYGAEVEHLADVRFPIVRTLTELPAPARRGSGLVTGEETEAHRAADAALALLN